MTAPTLDGATLDTAIRQARSAATPLWDALLAATAVSPQALREALALHHAVHVFDHIDTAGAELVSPAAQEPAAAWLQHAGRPCLLAADPWNGWVLSQLARRTGAILALALAGQLDGIGEPAQAVAHPTAQARAEGRTGIPAESHTGWSAGGAVVAFVDAAIARAYESGASDIHFESGRSGIGIKYRIDGVMAAGERLDDPRRAEEVISRIKVMAQLDITERRRPQDGRIHWEPAGREPLDLRVSVMPSIFGEDAVLRLLDRAQLRHEESTISLGSLGFTPALAARIRHLAARPHGMLLVTGPTGSGKTTTVYAALSEVNDGLQKIITIEDPVEYELPGVLQIPVNEQKGLTFATGLRSILRHDPDKILVGEIRDAETAEIAVQSSLTGHLVMTTVHANSLFDVLGRFQHFGIDPFGLASALNGVVVQRLLRRTCVHCVQSREPDADERRMLERHGWAGAPALGAAGGCAHCRQTGYRGRLVVAEVHELEDAHRDLIVRRASLSDMREAMYRAPGASLMAQALAQALAGHTTLEEIRRVVG
ncbi:MAG: type II/IV secretion system protein [Burkholderiaceae bacterium]|nr:type II/IV secretion system protein [Burkholderiaceae bacterium]